MRIDGLFNVQQLNQANVMDILSRLNIGDVIKAKVLEMTSGELLLKLFDGTVFKAAVAADIDAKPGELLELAVTAKGDGNITLETVKKNLKSENSLNDVKKLLISMDIPPKAENMALAVEFKAAGLNIVPGVFKKAAELISKFNELTPEKAVFLAAKDIKPEEGRIDNLVRLLEGRLKLGKQLDELQSVIATLSDELSINENIKTANSKILSTVDTNPDTLLNGQPATRDLTKQTLQTAQPAVQSSQNTDADISSPGTIRIKAEEQLIAVPVRNQPQTDMEAEEALLLKNAKLLENSELSAVKPVAGKSSDDILLKAAEAGSMDAEKQSGLKILKYEADDLEKLKNTFKSMFVNTASENLKTELDVKKLYRDIVEKLDMIKSTVMNSGIPGADDIAARVANIDDGMKLLNQINNSSAYYQIPLNISGFNTTGELYVMKRDQKRKRIDPQDVTMFLSLDTQNIGRIESVIDIKGRNVSMNLRAEELEIIDFIREDFKYLYNALVDKGYRLVDIKYRLIDDQANPLNMEKIIKKELNDGKTSVDMRI